MARVSIMALEGLETEEVVEQTTGVEQIADQPENDMVEMQMAQVQLQGIDDAMDEANSTGQTLDQVHSQMAQTVSQDGQGLEPAAAQAIQVAVEHMCTRLGFPSNKSKFALEGFTDKSTRVKATMEAMDDIKGWLKRIWDAIVNACKTAIDWVVKFYDKLFDGAAKLAKRANSVAAAAEGKIKEDATLNKDSKVTKGIMNQFNFTKYLVNGNKFMTGSEIISAIKELTAMNDIEGKAIFLLKSVGPIQPEKIQGEKLVSHIDSYLNSLGLKEATATSKIKPPERMSLYARELPFGNFSIYSYSTSDKNGENAMADIGKIKMFIDSNSEKVNEGTLADTPFELKDIVTSSKAIAEHMGKYSGLRTKQAELKKEQESVQADAEKAAKADGATDADKKANSIAAAFVRAQISMTSNALSAIRSYDINACKAVLDYASKSLSGYSVAKK